MNIIDIGICLKIILCVFILYVYIPSKALNFEDESSEYLDKVFISFIHANFITIILVHLLSFLKLFETFSLVFVFFAVYVVYIWVKGGKSPASLADALGMKIIVNILNMSEGKLGLFGELKHGFRKRLNMFFAGVKQFFLKSLTDPFGGLLILFAFSLAAYIRFKHAFSHLYLGASDCYVHLAWLKYLGSNNIYIDGIYPSGYHAIIAALNKIFFIDPYTILRFFGPLAGVLIVLSLYYVLKKNFTSSHIIWLAVCVYGILIDPIFPMDVWRQMSALPQEYAIIFFLPGLHFFDMFYKYNKNIYLLLAGECVALTLLIHPYVTVFLGLGYIVIFLINISKMMNVKKLTEVVVTMLLSIIIGFLPMIIAVLLGMEFHGSLGYIQRSVKLVDELPTQEQLVNPGGLQEINPYMKLYFVCIMIVFFVLVMQYLFKRKRIDKNEIKTSVTIILISIIFYVLFRARYFQIPEIMDVNRIGIFLAIMMAIVYSLTLKIFDLFLSGRFVNYLLKSIVCLACIMFIYSNANLRIPAGYQLEYDEAVQAYYEIKENFPALQWTIISPVEQYQQVMWYGWHYELWELAKKIDVKDNKLEIPTDYIFIFVEKYPLNSEKMVSKEDAEKPFPSSGEYISDFYHEEPRKIIQAKVYFWAEEYRKKHDNMEIYMDNEVLRVYFIKQDGMHPVNILAN